MALFQGNLYAKTIGYQTQVYVSLPNDRRRYEQGGPDKTLILLHGISDNASGWIRYGLADEMAEKYNIGIIIPEGLKSFWVDMAHGGYYTQYLTRELPELMGGMFRLPVDRKHLMIAGLSMGGYGAMHAALTEPDMFCAVGAFSGVMDVKEFFSHAKELETCSDCGSHFAQEIAAVTGEGENLSNREDLFWLAEEKLQKTGKTLPIYIACGMDDYLVYEQNQRFDKYLKKIDVSADFEVWKGGHDWEFWRVALDRFLERMIGNSEEYDTVGET